MAYGRNRKIEAIPTKEELDQFNMKISDPNTKEGIIQKFIDNNPNILLPLELSEFVRHLQYPKRNIKNPSATANIRSNRIPDFDGVKLEGLAYPVIIEAKGPNDDILESDGDLSKISHEVIRQLITATKHMLRPEGQSTRDKVFEKPLTEILEDEIIEEFESFNNSESPDYNDSIMIGIMKKLQSHGCSFFALIGQSKEFVNNSKLYENAQKLFASYGVTLLTYDELLTMNLVISEYLEGKHSIYTFFEKSVWKRSPSGALSKQNACLILTDSLKEQIQKTLYSISSNICFYGFGSPPSPSRTGEKEWAVLEVNQTFHIGMLWARPTYLKGDERLLWAGKYSNNWIVVKERLSEPLKDGIIWYIFQPPSEKEPII